VDECPLYDLEPEEPSGWMYGNEETLGEGIVLAAGRSADPSDPSAILCALLGSPNVASKRWAFEQYDSVVGSRTVRRPEQADAAVLMVPESDRAIAVSIDGNGRRVACDPYAGAVEAVLECAQNLACVGADPLGLTNCLNFGNPEKPGVAWQLDRAVLGLADACLDLRVPVVGGNVSLYNETEHGPIYPTPVVGMVGELPDPARAPGLAPRAGDRLILVGPFAPSLAGSELARQRGELDAGLPQPPITDVDRALGLVRDLVRDGVPSAAHDVSDGGLACALAEMGIAAGRGVEVDLDPLVELRGGSGETCLFGEGTGGIVLAVEDAAAVLERAGGAGVEAVEIGTAGGELISIAAAERDASVPLVDAERAWRSLGQQID
jgi:phosphoribosylformylglycinamidine (FGAM) synthase-like enzyme